MHYWRVYSIRKDPRIDVRGTAENRAEAQRRTEIAVKTLARELGLLPSDLTRVWADEDNDEVEVYRHLPHHPRMVELLRKRVIA